MTAAAATADKVAAPGGRCRHCGQQTGGASFCCSGCEAAFDAIQGMGLGSYYARRVLDFAARPPRPGEDGGEHDLIRHVTTDKAGRHVLTLAIDGLQCGACVWLIESVLARDPSLAVGRVNMTTRRLRLTWDGPIAQVERFAAAVERLGYRLVPFDPTALAAATDRSGQALLRALAVAGFAAANVMMYAIAVWAGLFQGMGPGVREMMEWISALVALPAIAYAGLPFFRSGLSALLRLRTNMDVPISIGVLTVTGVSVVQTLRGAPHVYFDSATTLLFFLLLGRVLDHAARGRARATAEQMVLLQARDVAVLLPDGRTERRPAASVATGNAVLVGAGERIGIDGVVESGLSQIDTSLVTGEAAPVAATPGLAVFAGTLNLDQPLVVRVGATGEATLLAECVRLIEAAEARRGRFVVLADRVARRYAPAVHIGALATFLYWWGIGGASPLSALLTASSVLIVTCPCALGLAVPAVQVIATGALFRRGILLRSPTALERLATVDTIILDKTGTLTEPSLVATGADAEALGLAAALAAASRHPLARLLVTAAGDTPRPALSGPVVERHGAGLEAGDVRLGSAEFVGIAPTEAAEGPEIWLARPGAAPVRFRFTERLRVDAVETLARLRSGGAELLLVSGDAPEAVARAAAAAGIPRLQARTTPPQKVALVEQLRAQGRHVLMVGDGLNDSPALAAADVSASPASAADLSQTIADAVFQGAKLAPVALLLTTARRALAAMRQNIALSLGYNLVMVPLAMAGAVTPWLAAVAMSASSLAVMGNSLRLRGGAAVTIILALILLCLALGGLGLLTFLWALRSGQFEDLEGAAQRILFDDPDE